LSIAYQIWVLAGVKNNRIALDLKDYREKATEGAKNARNIA
jgi:hypothetical protein